MDKNYRFVVTCSMCKFAQTCAYKDGVERFAAYLAKTFNPNYAPAEDLPIDTFSFMCDYWQYNEEDE